MHLLKKRCHETKQVMFLNVKFKHYKIMYCLLLKHGKCQNIYRVSILIQLKINNSKYQHQKVKIEIFK